MNAFRKTGFMALLAVVSCAIAFYYYPKAQRATQSQMLNEPLFAEYEAQDVDAIEIESFDREKERLQRIQLSRKETSWVIPEKENFLVTNAGLVAAALGALQDCVVLQEISNQESDQEKYGVVEPAKANRDVIGVGRLIRLKNRRGEDIASLIVGLSTRESGQCFVRVPGQPQIYVVEFNPLILQTDFSAWVDGDLMRILGNRNQSAVALIDIQYYRINTEENQASASDEPEKKYIYRVRIYQGKKNYLFDLWVPDEQEQLPERPAQKGIPVPQEVLQQILGAYAQGRVQDVRKTTRRISSAMQNPQASDNEKWFQPLADNGFFYTGMNNGQHQFDAANGEIAFTFEDGSRIRIHLGGLAGIGLFEMGKISRHLFLSAEVVEKVLPMPKKPEGMTNTSGETDEQTSDEANQEGQNAAEREYQKRLKERNNKLEQARRKAEMINQLHADWVYVVGEMTTDNWFLPLEFWLPSKAPPQSASPNQSKSE